MTAKGKKEPKKLRAACQGCGGEKNHTVVASTEYRGDDESMWWIAEYQIIKCQGCDNIAFRRVTMNSEEMEPAEDGYEPVQHVSIFPDPDTGRQPIDDYFRLPKKLQSIYLETLKALNASQPVLTGIGIRAIVETVCNERKAKGHNLEKKIDDLVAQQVLAKDGAAVLHKLRTMGNKAAHEVKPHSKRHLSLAVDVVNHLLLGVYVLPKHVDETFDD